MLHAHKWRTEGTPMHAPSPARKTFSDFHPLMLETATSKSPDTAPKILISQKRKKVITATVVNCNKKKSLTMQFKQVHGSFRVKVLNKLLNASDKQKNE